MSAVSDLKEELAPGALNSDLLTEAIHKAPVRVDKRNETYNQTVSNIPVYAISWRTLHRYHQYWQLP